VPFTSVSSRLRSCAVAGSLAALAALGLAACSSSSSGSGSVKTVTAVATPSSGSTSGTSASVSPSSSSAPPAKPIHVKLLNVDGSTYGVGMPVIAFFSHKPASAKALSAATSATVNGKPVKGGWYFEVSSYYKGYPVEAHYRLPNYWPAHSKIFIDIKSKGVSAGGGYAYDDSLTSTWSTGARNISVVNDATHKMTVTSDGHVEGTYPVSLGTTKTPTKRGTKVIMEKRPSICMTDTAHSYYECGIKFDQRLTFSGEYLHSAPWNHSLGFANLSNGCTNLSPAAAQKLYSFLRVGDVVQYPNANGPAMQLGDGYGDWNVSWSEWQTGGLVSTTA
jgi:lipoprotein-anchoring transpeptidase ErfK/SrfK